MNEFEAAPFIRLVFMLSLEYYPQNINVKVSNFGYCTRMRRLRVA